MKLQKSYCTSYNAGVMGIGHGVLNKPALPRLAGKMGLRERGHFVWQVLFSQFSTGCSQNVAGKRLLNMPELKAQPERPVCREETSIKTGRK